MTDELSRRGFLRNVSAASLAAFFGGKIVADAVAEQATTTTEPAFDFRSVCWGMSQEEVIASEDLEVFLRMPGFVMYKHSLDQLPLILTYQFAPAPQGNGTVCFAAVLQTDLMQNLFYIDSGIDQPARSRVEEARYDYERIKEAMRRELGEVVVEDAPYHDDEWVQVLRSDREGNSPEMECTAGAPEVAEHLTKLRGLSHDDSTLESLMCVTRWSNARTRISLGLVPQPFGGVMLLGRHDSIRLFPRTSA